MYIFYIPQQLSQFSCHIPNPHSQLLRTKLYHVFSRLLKLSLQFFVLIYINFIRILFTQNRLFYLFFSLFS